MASAGIHKRFSTYSARQTHVAALLVGVAVTALIVAFSRSKTGHGVEFSFARSIEFALREHMGKAPRVDPGLKIFSIDDKTAINVQGGPRFDEPTWRAVLEHIARAKPRVILIDGLFSIPITSGKELEDAIAGLEAIDVPIAVGAFLTPQAIAGRDSVNLTNRNANTSALQNSFQVRDATRANAYGPNAVFDRAFPRVGHIVAPGLGRAVAVYRTPGDNFLPHIALHSAETVSVDERGKMVVNGRTLSMSGNGEMPVNFLSPEEFYAEARTIRGVVERALNNEPLTSIAAGDTVLILPEMFTGSTDFVESPWGNVPGGILVASVVSSVLQGNWLREVPAEDLISILAGVVGTAIGMTAGVGWFIAAIILVPLVTISGSLGAFTYEGLLVPWFWMVIVFTASALSTFFVLARQRERRSLIFRVAFEGAVPDDRVAQVASRVTALDFSPREETLSIMFIDVVGFSMTSERLPPEKVFSELRQILTAISAVIHRHGGVVDKALGDGLLCYFGQRIWRTSEGIDPHLAAVEAAIEIQRASISANSHLANGEVPIYPLRIGINTAAAFVGDLGAGLRVDFTAVGSAVNFAKRLESAADVHCIMLSAGTVERIAASPRWAAIVAEGGTQKSFVQAKHRTELIPTLQIDPAPDVGVAKRKILDAFRRYAGIGRHDERWSIATERRPQIATSAGPATLMNFSLTGMQIALPMLLSKGTIIELDLRNIFQTEEAAGNSRLAAVRGDVRWSSTAGANEYLHGVMFTGLTPAEQKDISDRLFTRYVEKSA